MKPTLSLALAFTLLASAAWSGQTAPVIDVYKSPTCGCCSKWIDHLKSNGFTVRSHDTRDVVQHKIRLGVPQGYDSCHTAEVGGYVIEGHVPAKDIKRLLKEKPAARGLTVPGMPIGSPGMEQGSHKDVYDVILLGRDGRPQVYSRY
ncbi:MAG: DUF411 domain-containing protein [Pseudomonadota bacterium]